jgi:ABC-type polysaccharide/polyol phosphate transport system ATPase subunit
MSIAPGSIDVRGLVKTFRHFHSTSMKDVFVRLARNQRLSERRTVLASIDFTISPGEQVALLGRNGAGKSTLFRVLSGILKPDSGLVRVGGRIAPLIEITTGLVPDLTGLENLRLNAAILGLSASQTNALMDEIVSFAELENFIETPVRYYSSGMMTRLGFSIVAHVPAEIVFIDEALSVGDVEFQARCMAKMSALANRGVTLLYASHDRDSVSTLCRRALWIDAGHLREDGPVSAVIAAMTAAEFKNASNVSSTT